MEVLQKEYIEIRLEELVESTVCSEEFLQVFVSKGIFTEEEVTAIESENVESENEDKGKASKFYALITTKPGAYDVLMEALETTDQIDILEILEEYYEDGDVHEDEQCWTASIERLKQSALNNDKEGEEKEKSPTVSECPLDKFTSRDGEPSDAKRRKTDK